MFGFKRGKPAKPANALDEFIFAVYGNPPPPKRANVEQAIALASDKLLSGLVDEQELRRHALALAATPIPYSTHDLAVSMALQFFKQPKYAAWLRAAQAPLKARLQAILWCKEGLVVAPLMKSFGDILYALQKSDAAPRLAPELKRMLDKVCGTPDVSGSTAAKAKSIPAPDNERHQLIRRLILARVGPKYIGCDINEAPLKLILSTADSAIFLIVEQYFMFRDSGLDEHDAVRALNESQAATLALIGQELPLLNHPATLFAYARHFINSQFSQEEPMSDELIRAEIDVVKAFYCR
jgi:hypothetical protein